MSFDAIIYNYYGYYEFFSEMRRALLESSRDFLSIPYVNIILSLAGNIEKNF